MPTIGGPGGPSSFQRLSEVAGSVGRASIDALKSAKSQAGKLAKAPYRLFQKGVEEREAAKTEKTILNSLKLTTALKAGSGFKNYSGSISVGNCKKELPILKSMIGSAPKDDQYLLRYNAETLIGLNALNDMKGVDKSDTEFLNNLSYLIGDTDLINNTENMNHDLKDEIKAIKKEIEEGNPVPDARIDQALHTFVKELAIPWQKVTEFE